MEAECPPPFSATTKRSCSDSLIAAPSRELHCQVLVNRVYFFHRITYKVVYLGIDDTFRKRYSHEKQQLQRLVFPGLLVSWISPWGLMLKRVAQRQRV